MGRPRKGHEISPQLILETYQKVGSARKTAAILCISASSVAYHLKRMGVWNPMKKDKRSKKEEEAEVVDPLLTALKKEHPERWAAIERK